MISIRRYLDMKLSAPTDPAAREEMLFHASLARLAGSLLSEIGGQCRNESHARFEPLAATVTEFEQRLESANSPPELDALGGEVARLMEGYKRAREEMDRQQTMEVQKMVSMLQQAIETLSRGSERSVSRLRRIEADIRSATQIAGIVALRDRLRACVEQIREDAQVEEQDSAAARARLENDIFLVREGAALARAGVPGRAQAEERIAAGPGDSYWVAIRLERVPAIKSRHGTGVAERYLTSLIEELSARLPGPRTIFRWNEQSLLVELPGRGPGPVEADIRARLGALPRMAHVDVGGRMAVFEHAHRWCVILPDIPAGEVVRRIESFLSQ